MFLSDENPGIWFTMGPESNSVYMVEQLFEAGATGARLTFSFGTPELQEDNAAMVHRVAERKGSPGTVVADLEGGNVRIGDFVEDSVSIESGEEVYLVPPDSGFDVETGEIPVRSREFLEKLSGDDRIIVGDGSAVLEVEDAGTRVRTESVSDGKIDSNRGIVLQGGGFEPPALTEKDRDHLNYIAGTDEFDAVAVSFVSDAEEVAEAREILEDGGEAPPIVAKIETSGGMDNLREICEEADAVMVARGDLALFLPWTELGEYTESIVQTAQGSGIPWIMATQVAEGLERFAFPTRAEITDLHRWREEGVDGVLLSYETAFGEDPVEAVRSVRKILS